MADTLKTKLSALKYKGVFTDTEYAHMKKALQKQQATKWIEEGSIDGDTSWKCPSCKEIWVLYDGPSNLEYNYCPKCGQKLVERSNAI